jgi:clan AA aspartic protease (TIGR02281 family)
MKMEVVQGVMVAACVMLAASFPVCAADNAPEAPHCRYVNLKSIPVTFENERLNIDGTVNDQPIKMFVDTGAANTILTRTGAERLGLKLGHGRAVGGVGGESRGYQAYLDKVSIGPVEGKHITLPVFWDSSLDSGLDGLVGSDFLFQRDLDLSVKDHQMRIMHPLNCKAGINLAYWDQDASVVPMQEVLPDSTGQQGGDQGREVTVVINGQKLRAHIDSGAPNTLIDLAAAKRAGITPDSPGVEKRKGQGGGIGKQRYDVWLATFDTFALGDEVIPNAKVEIADMWGALKQEDPEWSSECCPKC